MGVVDADLKFIYVDVGTNGRISDGGVWRKCDLRTSVENKSLNIPDASQIPFTETYLNYYFVADDEFPLSEYLMKPYPGRGMTPTKRIFNYRLSRARRVVENAFGLLASKFAIFQTTINCKPKLVTDITLAAWHLHNTQFFTNK